MAANVLMPLLSLLVGWMALPPIRRWVGPVGYHLAALPVGLVGWSWVAAWAAILGQRFTWGYVSLAMLTYVALVAAGLLFLVGRADAEETNPQRFPIWTYLPAGALIGGAAWLASALEVSLFTADSWADYEMMGMFLHDTGELPAITMAVRNALIPSFHAAARMMGADWTYAIYPVMGLIVSLFVLDEVYVRAVPKVGRALAGVLSVAATLLMASTAPFIMQSFYVHSHMISALCITISVVALGRAYIPSDVGYRVHHLDAGRSRRAWIALAGLSLSGLILARPDGLAYAVVPLALFFTLWAPAGFSAQELLAVFSTSFAVPSVVFGLAIARHGLWVQDDKLNASAILVLLLGYSIVAIALWQLPRWRSAATWLAEENNAARFSIAAETLFFVAAASLSREDFGLAIGNMSRNLIHRGGYNSLWVFAAGLVILALLFTGIRADRMVRHALVTIALFFMTASIVHGLTHVGRASWGDSFSRLAFHVVPLVFLLLGYVTTVVFEGLRKPAQ